MKYRNMGKWGAKLSVLGLGTYLNVGHKSSNETSKDLISLAYENGINFFDTADAYGVADSNGIKGQAEEFLGKILKEYRRESYFVLTKVFFPMGFGPNDKGLSIKHVIEGCNNSLKRLNMDYLDMLMCHRPDPETPIEETLWAMDTLMKTGKILYWGTSEWTKEQIQEASIKAKELGIRPMALSEPRYSLLHRNPERDLFDTTNKEGIGNVTFAPLANGMLTGKYIPGQPIPEGTRAADKEINGLMMQMYFNEENMRKSQELVKIANEMGVTASSLAIAWCLRRKEVTSVLIGATKTSQLVDNLKAVDIEIPEDVFTLLDKLYPIV